VAVLESTQLTKRFGGVVAVHNLDFRIEEGEVVGLIGPNGSGKTTVFNLLTGFLHPDKGRVRLDGRDITGRSPHEIARLGLVRTFQNLRPFYGLDVRENLRTAALPACTASAEARRRAHEVIEFLGLGPVADRSPRELPTGHLKMLEVGKALAALPRILLLDEPYAGLNSREVESFTAVIRRLIAQAKTPEARFGVRTIVLIEHVMRAVMTVCQRVIVLHHGEQIAQGPPDEMIHHPAVLSAYLGRKYVAGHPS